MDFFTGNDSERSLSFPCRAGREQLAHTRDQAQLEQDAPYHPLALGPSCGMYQDTHLHRIKLVLDTCEPGLLNDGNGNRQYATRGWGDQARMMSTDGLPCSVLRFPGQDCRPT